MRLQEGVKVISIARTEHDEEAEDGQEEQAAAGPAVSTEGEGEQT